MALSAWKQLVAGWPWFGGKGKYPIAAYSEFMPPPRFSRKPYGTLCPPLEMPGDPCGWPVTEYEETLQLKPGLQRLAHCIISALNHLGEGQPTHGISKFKLTDNPYWPTPLAERAGSLSHERYVVIMPLALSRTQDDKGRIRWTLFGGSEQGPARAFWRSFFTGPRKELPSEEGLGFVRRLLQTVYDEPEEVDLGRAGFRILPFEGRDSLWQDGPLPKWAEPYILKKGQPFRGLRYLLTFRPFSDLPEPAQRAYLEGRLHLLPFPGSLVFWGIAPYRRMREALPLAEQIPLQHLVPRSENVRGIRVPQSGWMHEARPNAPAPSNRHGPFRNTYRRTHRWAKLHRYEDELAVPGTEDKLAHVLFSSAAADIGLYGKPMARNAQIWSHDCELLLDGPRASWADIQRTMDAVREGGSFGYRFQFPAMRVGCQELYWHRPLVAYRRPSDAEAVLLPDPPLGYLTAYRADQPDIDRPMELWPRLLHRELHLAAVNLFDHNHCDHPLRTINNIRKLADTWEIMGERPLPRTFARQLLTIAKEETLEQWLESLPARASVVGEGVRVAEALAERIEAEDAPAPRRGKKSSSDSLTYAHTAKRSWEVNYWKTIAMLAEGRFVNKDNADCVRDPITQELLRHHQRDLEALGDYLVEYYTKVIAGARLEGKALVGDLPFHWRTDFNFSWSGGWLNNQEGNTEERDIIVVIPGRDRRRAVIMGDHYDTAYMADHYEKDQGGSGARLAAAGADDNHSATAALMLGAPIFLELSRKGKLACDVWLIHLTGEEFPSDCMGARHLCERLVEGDLRMRLPSGKWRDLSRTRAQGVYVLDMIAHNNDHDRDVFQIAPGTNAESMWLAYQAHMANEIWNRSTAAWNRRPARRGCTRGKRSGDGKQIPATAMHPRLSGEIRPAYDPRSTLYNTDGQIFSDAGVPVVLFMENYDINRTGYHDSHDNMTNIDLDYGAALAAITIETVARAATEKPPPSTKD
jgi:hypothetical protein